MKKNSVKFSIQQHVAASITGTGKLKDDLDLYHTFETETDAEINSHNLGLWLQANLIKFVKLQKLQGEETFRQNKPVDITIKVNSKEEKVKMKFSLNLERIVSNIEKYPLILGQLFVPVAGIGSISAKTVMQIANGDKVVIAKSKKEDKKQVVIEIPVEEPRLSLENVELTESDLS